MLTLQSTLSVPSSEAGRYEDGTERFETLAYKIKTPGNHPEGSIHNSEHGEILKSRINGFLCNL
jgi:hypothetical protein